MNIHQHPVSLGGKVYAAGWDLGNKRPTVHSYTPSTDEWVELPSPPVEDFGLAVLKGQLLLVGGKDNSTKKSTNTILLLDETSGDWVEAHPPMPLCMWSATVVGYGDYLIVTCGFDDDWDMKGDVHILDAVNKKWISASPLPVVTSYLYTVVGDELYLVEWSLLRVLRAHIPTLVSKAEPSVWETLNKAPLNCTGTAAISNVLLSVGGTTDFEIECPSATDEIYQYNREKGEWQVAGKLPKDMWNIPCCVVGDELVVLGAGGSYRKEDIKDVYVAKMTLKY